MTFPYIYIKESNGFNFLENINKIKLSENIKSIYFDNKSDDECLIKMIECKFHLDLKSYNKEMVIDIFKNGITDENKLKYLGTINQIDTSSNLNFINLNFMSGSETESGSLNKKINFFGLYLMCINKFTESIEYFKIALDMCYTPSCQNIARCYKNIGNDELVEQYYLKSIEIGETISYCYLGEFYLSKKSIDKGIEYLNKGFDMNILECGVILGDYYYNTDNPAYAKNNYLRVIEYIGNNPTQYYSQNVLNIFGKLGDLILANNYDDIDIAIDYYKLGIKHNNSLSYNLLVDIILYENELLQDKYRNMLDEAGYLGINYLIESIKINMYEESINILTIIYQKLNKHDDYIQILNLGCMLENYESICRTVVYLESNGIMESYVIKDFYKDINNKYNCTLSYLKIANYYSTDIINFEYYCSQLATNTNTWIAYYYLGISNILNNNLAQSLIYLEKALRYYWDSTYMEYIPIFFGSKYTHKYDIDDLSLYYNMDTSVYNQEYDSEFFISQYKNIFTTNYSIDELNNLTDTNIIEFINSIEQFFLIYTDNYYPVLFVMLIKILYNHNITLLKKSLNKILLESEDSKEFINGILQIIHESSYKTILNKIKRARKQKKYKECVVCYENKIHVKFDCGHEICCCCVKKMKKCYYNCV